MSIHRIVNVGLGWILPPGQILEFRVLPSPVVLPTGNALIQFVYIADPNDQ